MDRRINGRPGTEKHSAPTSRTSLVQTKGMGGERGVYSLDTSLKRSKIETQRECTWLSFFHRFSIGDSSVDHFSLSNLFASRSERISTLSWLITCKTEQTTPDTDAAGDCTALLRSFCSALLITRAKTVY